MKKNESFLPYGLHLIDDDDVDAVVAVLKSDFLTTGPATEAFEDALASRTNARHAVSCSSGTAALHLATLALNLGPGDCVIVPSITFLATANAARYVGADVVFADVDPDTGLMGPDEFRSALKIANDRAKAVIPVHLAGQNPDMQEIAGIARENNIAVIEDACHALGSVYDGKKVGGCADSDMAVFSFHPVKTVAMGEGGAITTNDEELAKRMRSLRSHGMTRTPADFTNSDLAFEETGMANPWYYEMPEMGFNFRASDIHCALGLSQLNKLTALVTRRRELASLYDTVLDTLSAHISPVGRTPGSIPAWHLYISLIDFDAAGISRSLLMRQLHDRGIGTQVHYIPVHHQPYYRGLYGETSLPGADAYYSRCLSLPLHPGMENRDVERVADALSDILPADTVG